MSLDKLAQPTAKRSWIITLLRQRSVQLALSAWILVTVLIFMTTQNTHQRFSPERNRLFAGIALIGIGALLLIAQFIQAQWLSVLILPTLGAIFLLWGLIARNPGLLVPGGILSGIGLGAYLNSGPFVEAAERVQGGVFLLAFAAGWILIVVASLAIRRRQWWPLIPGSIMAIIGVALMGGDFGLQILEWVGKLWPLILIGIGLGVLWQRR